MGIRTEQLSVPSGPAGAQVFGAPRPCPDAIAFRLIPSGGPAAFPRQVRTDFGPLLVDGPQWVRVPCMGTLSIKPLGPVLGSADGFGGLPQDEAWTVVFATDDADLSPPIPQTSEQVIWSGSPYYAGSLTQLAPSIDSAGFDYIDLSVFWAYDNAQYPGFAVHAPAVYEVTSGVSLGAGSGELIAFPTNNNGNRELVRLVLSKRAGFGAAANTMGTTFVEPFCPRFLRLLTANGNNSSGNTSIVIRGGRLA